MSKRITDNELLQLVHFVKAKIALLPIITVGDWASADAHHAASKALIQELVEHHGARISRPLGASRLAMAGVSATSAISESYLLNNWINAAYRELDKRRAS